MNEFELIGSEVKWRGRIVTAGVAEYRHSDGEVTTRDAVWHPGAVGIVAVEDEAVWLTRQPREVPGLRDSLEIPAGKLDVEGEPPLQTAQRELAEEVGVQAAHWEQLFTFYSSGGFSDERIWLYLATGLSPIPGGATADSSERISSERWSLVRLDEAIAECQDAKSLIALLWLRASP